MHQSILIIVSLALGSWAGIFLLPKLNPYLQFLCLKMAEPIRKKLKHRKEKKKFREDLDRFLKRKRTA